MKVPLERALDSQLKADILHLFHQDVGLSETAEQTARRLNRKPAEVQQALEDLVEIDILWRNKKVYAFGLTKDKELQDAMLKQLASGQGLSPDVLLRARQVFSKTVDSPVPTVVPPTPGGKSPEEKPTPTPPASTPSPPAYGPRDPVGIPGFDEMTGGGLPVGHLILVLGEPGAGKTVFASQFLINGINKFDEKGIYVSLKESKEQYYDEMRSFGWDFELAEQQKKFSFIDASPNPRTNEALTLLSPDFTVTKLLTAIKDAVQTLGAKRVVIDKLPMLNFHFLTEQDRRKGILEIYLAMLETHATCLLLSDLRRIGLKARDFLPEEYLCQGTILMQTMTHYGANNTN